jgi:hypothetical protein
MIFPIILLLTALVISGIAGYFSIIGLTYIFSASPLPIFIMGAALEVGKLVTASYVYRQWDSINVLMRTYFIISVIVLSLLTSMGIFGFLSKAHSDQNLVSGDVLAKVAIYDEKIKISRENIESDRKAIKQLDDAVDQVMGRSTDEKGADKAVAIRRGQSKERSRLIADIEAEQKKITSLNEERAPIAAEMRKVEAEVGPIKYIAAFMYGATDASILEKAVSWMIILIIVVFDPLAILLVIGANSMMQRDKKKTRHRNMKNSIEIDKNAVFSIKNKDLN